MLIENFEVGAVLMPDNKSDTLTYARLISALQNKNIELIPAEEGYTTELGGLLLCVLFASADATDENDMSAVVRISFGETSAIFTGDAGESAEKMILEKYPEGELRCGILKVGHHGSSTSTCTEWAEALSPQFAVISCGAVNDYGHPHDEVRRRLAAVGAEIFRTDLDGTVCFASDGLRTYKTLLVLPRFGAAAPVELFRFGERGLVGKALPIDSGAPFFLILGDQHGTARGAQ